MINPQEIFYPYESRMKMIHGIIQIFDQDEKRLALIQFINEEKSILDRLHGEPRSQALDLAKRTLQSLLNQPPAPGLAL